MADTPTDNEPTSAAIAATAMAISPELQRIFDPEGPLAQAIRGFRPRPQQLEMAQRIADAIANNQVLVAEAGTGTGKTFAYLAPALLSGGKVVISTGTKTLQDQLFNRDLPTVRDALKVGATIALLKGRSNYLCPYHLERAAESGRMSSREEASHLRKIVRFAKRTKTSKEGFAILRSILLTTVRSTPASKPSRS